MCSDEYEISDPLTIGGATGTYEVSSPYNTECEWAIISALGIGTLASTATFVVGSKNPNPPTLSSSYSFGNVTSTGRDNNNPLPAYPGALTSQAPFVTYGGDNYMPLPSPASVYVQTNTPASTIVLVTIQFRRKLDRVIPDKPRQKPHTHSHVAGRRGHRTMMAGFAAQYPEEGQPYQHVGLPPQDTEENKRLVSPLQLGPTNITHRGTARGDKNGRR